MSAKLPRLTTALLLLFACRTAPAALQAQLAPGSSSRTWQMIDITFPATPGNVEVSLQDARPGTFGPEFARRLPGNAGHAWLPMPLVAPAELTGAGRATWPVHIVLRQPDGSMLEEARAELVLDGAHTPRMASSAPVPGFDNLVRLSEDDILSGPPLLFAGCDYVYLTPDLQRRMTRARATALLAAGAQLIAPGDGPPGEDGTLQEFAWEQAAPWPEARVWITPSVALPRPEVVEPGLGRYRNSGGGGAGGGEEENLHARAIPWRGRYVLLLLGPASIVCLLFSRGIFRRRATVALGAGLGLLAIAGGAILLLHAAPLPIVDLASWRQATASPSASEGVLLHEQLRICESPLGSTLRLEVAPGEMLLPAATTLKEYRAFHTLRILLTSESMTLTGPLAARQPFTYECRSADAIGLLPAFPQDASAQQRLLDSLKLKPENVWWLLDGYVHRSPGDPGELFPKWAQGQSGGGSVWYEMRYAPGHRYLLANANGQLEMVDFGPEPASSSP